MKSSPAFQYYPSDFLSSTASMTEEEVGVYWRLLSWSWINGPLPAQPERVRRCCSYGGDNWASVWATLAPRFTATPDGLINGRLERTREDQEIYRQAQSKKGIAGAKSRARSAALRALRVTPNTGSTVVSTPVQPVNQPSVNRTVNPASTESQPSVLRSSPLILNSDLRSTPLPSHTHGAETAPSATPLPPPKFDGERLRQRIGITPRQGLMGSHRDCPQGTWAACAKNVCLPKKLFTKWVGQIGVEQVLAFVNEVSAGIAEGVAIGDDDFDFWRKQWAAKHGVLEKPGGKPLSNGEATIAAMRRLNAKWEAQDAGLIAPDEDPVF